MFMILPEHDIHPTYDTGLWVHSPFFAGALEDLFDHAWKVLIPADKRVKELS